MPPNNAASSGSDSSEKVQQIEGDHGTKRKRMVSENGGIQEKRGIERMGIWGPKSQGECVACDPRLTRHTPRKEMIYYVHDNGVGCGPSANIGRERLKVCCRLITCSLGAKYRILFQDIECK